MKPPPDRATLRHSYDATDLLRAEWEITLRGGIRDTSCRRLLVTLADVANGLVTALKAPDGHSDTMAGALGVSAFSYGFLVAAGLRGQELPTVPLELLPDALTGVATRGRHAIIAADCDLQAFAELQLRTTRSLAAHATGHKPLANTRPPAQLGRLFESGFALGLLLCETSTGTTAPNTHTQPPSGS